MLFHQHQQDEDDKDGKVLWWAVMIIYMSV